MVKERINEILEEARKDIESADSLESLQEIRNKYLSKKSELMSLMSTLGSASPEEKKELGQALNMAKGEIANLLNEKQEVLAK